MNVKLIAVVVLLFAIGSAQALIVVEGANLRVDLAKYDPFPAEAGKLVRVWFKAENTGSEAVRNATFILEPEYPFSLPNNDSVKNYGRIGGGSDILVEYTLLVDNQAAKGNAELILKYNLGGEGVYEKNFSVNVGTESERAELNALYVDLDPKAYPGGTSRLVVDIVNTDKGTAFFTIVKAESDVTIIERNELFIGTLEGDDSDSADFDLEIKDGVEPGTYPVKITMVYKDEDSNVYESSSNVEINVVSVSEAKVVESTPAWMYIVFIIFLLIIIRLAIPFIHWLVKPFKKRK